MIDIQKKTTRQDSGWFRHWFNSAHYNKIYSKRNEQEAAAFIDRLIEHLKPRQGARMIDIGCGNGRHAKHLAARGFAVTGFDLAAASIREAKKHETASLHFLRHDMRMPFGTEKFDYALNLFTSFGYFSGEEHNKIISNIANALKKDGYFVFDYLNAQFSERHLVPSENKEIDGVVYNIERWTDDHHFFKKITISGDAIESALEYTEKVARFSLQDMDRLFEQHHLQRIEIFGDYDLNGYDFENSPRMLLIAQKRIM